MPSDTRTRLDVGSAALPECGKSAIQPDTYGYWEPCDGDSCGWDFQFVSDGHIKRSFFSLLRLARAVDYHAGDGATCAFAGKWTYAWSGVSPRTNDRVPCDEAGMAEIEWDDDADDYTTGCTNIRPTTWVTMPEEPQRRVKATGRRGRQ